MAYDKVIDSSALDANLASIAEAIRTKGGTTDQLVFPAGRLPHAHPSGADDA